MFRVAIFKIGLLGINYCFFGFLRLGASLGEYGEGLSVFFSLFFFFFFEPLTVSHACSSVGRMVLISEAALEEV